MTMAKGKYAGLTAAQKWAKNPKHTIPFATHEQNVAAKKALGGSLDLTAPPNGVQAVREATSAADLQYGPQVQQAQQLQANIEPWFREYQAMVAGYAQQAQQRMAPVLNQAATYQQGAAAQTAPGLDPNSAAGQQSAQAAAGRGALAQLGNDALNTNAQATQDFFGGQQNEAARVQPQVAAAAGQQVANAQSQRGAALQGFLTTARQNAQNYAIARGTLNLNNDKAQSDADAAAANTTEKHRHNVASETNTANTTAAQQTAAANKQAAAGAKPNKYGIPAAQWNHWSTSHRQRIIDAFNAKGAQGADDTAAAKHAGDVHAATGKVENKITDVNDYWQTNIGGETDDKTKPLKDAKGKSPKDPGWKPTYAPRKTTQADADRAKIAKYGTLAKIAIAVRDGKKLDQSEIDYLHNIDPNFRIPREWLPYDPNIKAGSKNDPKPTSGQQGGVGGK
jgi:hypothetical protein